MEVFYKEGMLFLLGAKFGKKIWRKMWALLFKPSSTGVGRLELYTVLDYAASDQKKIHYQKTPERKVVRLSDCLSVSLAPKESCPQGCKAFYLNTTQSTYTLASTTSDDWLSAFSRLAFQDPGESDKGGFKSRNGLTMEDNDLYSCWKTDPTLCLNRYQVTVQSTEASRRCQLTGMYLISPETEAVKLLDLDTGHIIYHWPYNLLRKFGQVEDGFSFEAGRRCESGEGVFIFLSRHGLQIFQAILKQCTVEKKPSDQQLSLQRRSLSDQSLVIFPSISNPPAGPPVTAPVGVPADSEDESADHYATINDIPPRKPKRLSLLKSYFSYSKGYVGEEEDDDERCHSLDSLNLNFDRDQSIYYNVIRSTPPLIAKEEFLTQLEDPECIYSELTIVDTPSISNSKSFTPPPLPPVPPPPPCPLSQFVALDLPKPRFQHQPPSTIQPWCIDQAQPADDMIEMEEAISACCPTAPKETPGSFKRRLADIISKDLAKFQLPVPPERAAPHFLTSLLLNRKPRRSKFNYDKLH